MLGELIYEETGTVTGTRVVESSGDETKVEVDLQTHGVDPGSQPDLPLDLLVNNTGGRLDTRRRTGNHDHRGR